MTIAFRIHCGKIFVENYHSTVSLFSFFLSRFPFNWKTFPTGFIFAFSIESLLVYLVSKLNFTIAWSILGAYWMLTAFIDDIKQELTALNKNWKSEGSGVELTKKLHDIIQLNAEVKQLS